MRGHTICFAYARPWNLGASAARPIWFFITNLFMFFLNDDEILLYQKEEQKRRE